MRVMRTIAVAFSMFSAVPMPQFEWDEESLRYMLVAFPLVGVLVGTLMWGWLELAATLGVSQFVRALVLTAIPPLVTGGIHLDGFCDTWDALSSHQEPKRMRQILKDPHIGAFGVMHLVLLLLATYVLWLELVQVNGLAIALGFALSRALAGYSVAAFPIAEGDGLARTFAEGSNRRNVRRCCAILSVAVSAGLVACGAWSMVACALGAFVWYRAGVVRRFGGLSGDLSGWFVQTCELWMLVALYAFTIVGVVA